MDDALKEVNMRNPFSKVFVCGGEGVYRELLPYCSKILLTEVYLETKSERSLIQNPENETDSVVKFPQEFLQGFELKESSGVMLSRDKQIPYERKTFQRIHPENNYLNLCKLIMEQGDVKGDRTGTGTISYFGPQMEFDMTTGEFPLLTTKRVYWKGVVEELLWFVRGETDAGLLSQKGVKIWDGNTSRDFLDKRGLGTYPVGDIGPGYGFQWRHWGAEYPGKSFDRSKINGIDQLKDAVRQIRETPESRRIIVSAWNVSDIDKMALPPCHLLYQFNVSGEFLDLKMYQRSADWFLGVPFNIASYALLLLMVCKITNKKPRRLILTFGDAHVYSTHLEQIKEQLTREPYKFPKMEIIDRGQKEIDEFQTEDFKLIDYRCHPSIKAEMAV